MTETKRPGKDYLSLEAERSRYSLMLHITKDIFFEYSPSEDKLYLFNSPGEAKDAEYLDNLLHSIDNHTCELTPDTDKMKDILLSRPTMAREDELRLKLPPRNILQWYRVTVRYNSNSKTLIGNVHDINQAKEEVQQLKELNQIDPLSKVYNKATAIAIIERKLSERAPGEKCALAVLDIDNFKQVNDSFGHLYGDAVISMVAGTIKNLLDMGDVIGRFGGDEFFLFINDASPAELDSKLEKIRVTVYNMSAEMDISCSIGATVGVSPCSYPDLFAQADSALYRAKKNGKNRYEYFDGNYYEESISYADNIAENTTKDHSITETVLEIASKSKDPEGAIFNILRHVAVLLNLDSIEVLYYDVSDNRADLLFQYYRELNGQFNVVISDKKKGYYAHEDMVLLKEILCESQYVKYGESFKNRFTAKYRNVLAYSDGLAVIMASNVTPRDSVFCVMNFKDYNENREWTGKEIKDILDVEKIVAMYLNSTYTTTPREKAMEQKLAFMPSGAYTIPQFYEESGKLTHGVSSENRHLALVHFHIKGLYTMNRLHGRTMGSDFIDGFVRLLLSKDSSNRIVAQYTDINNIIMLMSHTDAAKAKADILNDMNEYSAEKNLPADSPLIIRAAFCPFEPGMVVGDAVEAAAYENLHSDSDENCIIDAVFQPLIK
ncbi:MAG: GGDEF domain-containing protein [Lachnospiraceae bacterium]|nr:GGDEF domain-containing protein [Lachnospiraceae bacterium]